MSNQQKFWNDVHDNEKIFNGLNNQTEFAEEVVKLLKTKGKILDLGCGLGFDGAYFAQTGHTVIATDFAETAIKKNQVKFVEIENLQFEVLDMTDPFRFSDNQFDMVYARLSLHYFTDAITRKIMSEIRRILKPNGYLCFLCKSTAAPIYGQGIEIEKDMYELKGHVRHFFSEGYVKSLLKDTFQINVLESGDRQFYGKDSAFVKVFAQAVI